MIQRNRRFFFDGRWVGLGTLCFLVIFSCSRLGSTELILINGDIYTVNEQRPHAEALVIQDGKITFVGDSETALTYRTSETEVLDLKGRTVLPGLHDSHVHPISGAEAEQFCQLTGLYSEQEIVEAIQLFLKDHTGDSIIRGRGWELTAFTNGNPTKQLLDKLIPDRPAVFTSWDGHNLWVNSKALEMAGITAQTQNPVNGRIEKDAQTGEPTGTLRETAMNLIDPILPKVTDADRRVLLKQALKKANRLGITSMVDASVGEASLKAYYTLANENSLTARMITALSLGMEKARPIKELIALRERYRAPRLNTNSVKIFADGVPEARTAAMIEPYHTHDGSLDYGILNFDEPTLTALCDSLNRAGFQIHIHAMGDKAINVSLNALEKTNKALRPHIAHLQIVAPKDLSRFGELKIIANFQPFWSKPDPLNMETIIPLVGEERSQRMYPMQSVADLGGYIAVGSDWPVSTLNPWHAMQVAVTRKLIDEKSETWISSEKVTLEQIIYSYTLGGAFAMHQEMETGSIEAGKWADLIVLNQSIFSVDEQEIHNTLPVLTLLGGEIVYKDETTAF